MQVKPLCVDKNTWTQDSFTSFFSLGVTLLFHEHSFIICNLLSSAGLWRGWSQSQLTLGEGGVLLGQVEKILINFHTQQN